MKRLINNGDIFDKYVSFEDKKFRDDTIKQFNWQGHRHISGTYSGAAYSTSSGNNFMAADLRNDSNPKGSLLVAAKNYTDQKIAAIGGGGGSQAKLYKHTITASSDYYGIVKITFYSYNNETINSKTELKTLIKNIGGIVATGYIKNGTSIYYLDSVLVDSNEVYAVGYKIDDSQNVSIQMFPFNNSFSYSNDISVVS